MNRLVLVDGNALLHRAYHATPPFTTRKGELVNAVYGFSSMILKVINDLQPDYLAVCWDEKGPTFRHQAYTQYKATRTEMDQALDNQYRRVHQVVGAFNVPEFSLVGYEADDLIGTLAIQALRQDFDGELSRTAQGKLGKDQIEVVVVTGDRDIMQLISESIKVLMPQKTIQDVGLYGEREFVARYGFKPKLLVDYKALSGDASDNIPGVSGIGDVTATKLIHQFETIENIYKSENLKTLPERMQNLLSEGAESAVMSKKLATLDLKAPIKLDLKKCEVHDFDKNKVVKLFEELEFKSLIKRIPGIPVILSETKDINKLDSSLIAQNDRKKQTRNDKTADLDQAVQTILKKCPKLEC